MNRLGLLVLLVVWLAGAVTGGLTIQSPDRTAPERDVHLLVETRRAEIGLTPTQVILRVETPWHSRWRVAAPLPRMLSPRHPERASPSSPPDAAPEARPSLASLFLRFLFSLP